MKPRPKPNKTHFWGVLGVGMEPIPKIQTRFFGGVNVWLMYIQRKNMNFLTIILQRVYDIFWDLKVYLFLQLKTKVVM